MKQWGKQEAEAEVKVSSSHEDVAMEKQVRQPRGGAHGDAVMRRPGRG